MTWLRKIWNVRGGGLYACGFAVTFVVLEVTSIVEDFQQVGLIADGHILEFLFNFVMDSFINTGLSFAWPAFVAKFATPYGAIGLGLAFWLFPRYVKKHIERWLFDDDGVAKPTDTDEHPEAN